MQTYKVTLYWMMRKSVEVVAPSLEEAEKKAQQLPLPKDGEYVEDSFEVEFELE